MGSDFRGQLDSFVRSWRFDKLVHSERRARNEGPTQFTRVSHSKPILSLDDAPPDDIEVYRAANTLVKRWGQDAPLEAARNADAMIERGDPEGLAVWKRILKAVDELLAQAPPKDGQLH